MYAQLNNRSGLAEHWEQSTIPNVVIGLIVYILIGLLYHRYEKNGLENKEGLPMKIKLGNYFSTC